MKNLFMNAAKRHFSTQSLARKGAIIGAVGLSLTVGLSIVGGAGSVGKKIEGKFQDLNYLQKTMNNSYSGQIPTSADMSNFNSMQNYIGNLGSKAADVSIDVARSAGPLAAFEARMGVNNDYVAMTEGQKKLFSFSGYGQAWENSRYQRAYDHFIAKGDKEGAEIAKRAWASTNSLNDSVGSKIGSWNAKGGGHGIDIASSAVEIGKNGNIHLYGWDIYDFAATNKRASFLYGGLGPNSLKGTKFYKAANKLPFAIDPAHQIKINEKGFGEVVTKGTAGAKDIELGTLFETKMSGIGNTLNKNVLWYLQEKGIDGEKMVKPTTLWAATFNAEGKSLDNATLKSLSKLRAGSTVARAMAGNFHYTFGAAAGLEAIGLMGVAAFAKRRKKRSTDAAGETLDKALDNAPDAPPTPANQEVGNALDTALENAPDAPPAPANQPIQSSLPENIIDELPPSAPPEPANTRMPNTQVDNIVQSSQPSPVRREGKVRDVEAIQRRQAEVDARRQTAEMVRQRREQVRNARNTSRGNAGGIPLPNQEERFSRFEDHFSRKRRRQQHQERMAAQKEQSIRRKEQQRAIKDRQRNNIIDQQMSAQQEVRQRRTENRRFSPQQTLEERLENFKAGKRYRNTTLGTPYSNASQNLNRSTFSFDPLNPSVSINPRTTIDDITKRANTQRDIFNFSREKLQYDFNSPVKTDLPLRFNQTEMYERELPKDINLSRSSIFETKSANTQRDIFSFSREKLQYEFDSVKRSAQPLDFQTQPESPFKFNKNGMYKRQLPEEVTLSKDIDLPRSSIFGTERANPQRNPFSFSREKLQYGYSNPIKRQLQPSNFQTQPESPFKFDRTKMYPDQVAGDIESPPVVPEPANPKTNPVEEVVKKKAPKKPKPANTPTNNVTEATNSVSAPRLNLNGQQKQDARSTKARAKVEQEAKDAVENLKRNKPNPPNKPSRPKPKLTPAEVDRLYARRHAAKAARNSTRRAPTPSAPSMPSMDPRLSPLDPSTFEKLDYKAYNAGRHLGDLRNEQKLAIIARQEGIDLTKLDRIDYARYGVKHNLPLGSNAFRFDPSYRGVESNDGLETFEIMQKNKARHAGANTYISEYKTIVNDPRNLIHKKSNGDRTAYIPNSYELDMSTPKIPGAKVSPIKYRGLSTQSTESWNYFNFTEGDSLINGELFNDDGSKAKIIDFGLGDEEFTFKSYVEFENAGKLDMQSIVDFSKELTKKGYKGAFKTHAEANQLTRLADHLVMHGATKEDSLLALEVAKTFFGDNIRQTDVGIDPNELKNSSQYSLGTSYSEMLERESHLALFGDSYLVELRKQKDSKGRLTAEFYEPKGLFDPNSSAANQFEKAGNEFLPSAQAALTTPTINPPTAPPTPANRVSKPKTLAESIARRRQRRKESRRRRSTRRQAERAARTPKSQPINDPTQAVNNASTPRPKVNDQQKDTKRNQDRKQNVHEEAQAVSNQGTQASQEAKNAQGNPDAIESKVIPAEEQAIIDAPKEAVKDVAEAAQKQKNAAAAAAATNPVEGKAAAEALKDATAELASKGKTALSHAGLAGAGAAGLFALYALNRDSRKEQVAPRRRHGRVHENPKGYDDGVRSTAVASAALGAVFGFGAIATNKLNPVSRGYLALGAAIGGGILASAANKNADSSSSILGMAGAGAAATLMYALVSKKGTAGLKALKSMLQRQGPKAAVDAAENAVRDIRKTFPMVQRLLSNEGLALGAGLVTLPAAHSIMVKHFANERRSQTDHGDVAFMPAWQDNKAGHTGFRRSNAPLLGLNNASAANVNFSGNVNTYYNSANVFERF